ncbi:hypothetical protein B7463_g11502, partial [Scytalidium lignicola]
MPYLETAQDWLTQSTLLLQARPTTTRITTKYNIAHADPSKKSKRQRRPPKTNPNTDAPTSTTPAEQAQNAAPRGTLTLKTYDLASNTTLKYRTTRGAEVSRLIQILGRVARPMCGLPEVKEEVGDAAATAGDAMVLDGGSGSGVATPLTEAAKPKGGAGQQGGAGGKKGKKKGKK